MNEAEIPPTIVIGVVPHKALEVLRGILPLAQRLGAQLTCVYVDGSKFIDASSHAAPIDPDDYDNDADGFPENLRVDISDALSSTGLTWETAARAGDPAQALADFAEKLNALMIVVGTRQPGARGKITEFFDGSVAVRLAHRQTRPVMVVPQQASDDE